MTALPAQIKADFPVFKQPVYGQPLVYLDSAATAQKPRQVLQAMQDFMAYSTANVHRGVYYLSQKATTAYEQARVTISRFINALSENEIVFTKNATEAINLVAYSYGSLLQAGDEVVISALEHHANIVPWQMLAQRQGIVLRVAPITPAGVIDLPRFYELLNPRTKLVAVSMLSNALGTIQPVREIITAAHAVGAKILLDACQAAAHLPIDVQALDCDFLVFSGHKLYGPSGIGVLYGKMELLQAMPPFLGGGDMIETVSFAQGTTYAPPPRRFEAGTPPMAEVIALAAAIDYVQAIGMVKIAAHDQALVQLATAQLQAITGLTIHGTAQPKSGIISFTLQGTHPQDIATLLDKMGIAIRVGHHCCMPLMTHLGIMATARASFGIYTTSEDIICFTDGLKRAQKILES